MPWTTVIENAPATPAYLGADLGPYPYISGFGLLQRITRLGLLQSADLTALGLRNRSTLDVLAATQQARAPRNRLVEALGLEQTDVAAHWSVEPWSPARLEGALDRNPGPVRRCMQCAEHGYHTAAFQLGSISHCPWHGTPLLDHCPSCRRPSEARFDAKGRLGRCACGENPFRVSSAASGMWDFPTQAADAWLTQYLDWANAERPHRWLLLPDVPHWRARALQSLAPPPKLLQPPSAQALPVTHFEGAPDPPVEGAFRGWSLFGGDRPLTFVPLPATLHGALCEATMEVVRAFPASAGTPNELAYCRGFEREMSLEANVVNRPDCFIEPFTGAGTGELWLNLSAVDPTTPAFCGALLRRVESALVAESENTLIDRSPAAMRAGRLETLEGTAHLVRALEALLIRGYKQGLDSVLRTMAKLPRADGARWLTPAAEVIGERGSIRAIRICWVPIPAPKLKRVVDIPVQRTARVRGPRAMLPRQKRARLRTRIR